MEESLQRTPLYEVHLQAGARMVPFGGWEMPVQYSSVLEEHRAVREAAGLFDVSHMGEFEVAGPEALALIQYVTTNNAARLAVGQAQYSLVCRESGTVVDDILVYRLAEDRYWLVVNAANIKKDWEWINRALATAGLRNLTLRNISSDVAQLALQGPAAEQILQPLVPKVDLSEIGFYWARTDVTVAGIDVLVLSRTGYTGEDGFELYCRARNAVALWEALMAAGRDQGLRPCGLGARDTLRFEVRLPLYGHELSEEVNPYEAGLGVFVKTKKGVAFIGREALVAIRQRGVTRKLVGLEMIGRGIPRQGYPVACRGQVVGQITTGTFAPSLNKNLGLAYVPVELAADGTELEVLIRGKAVPARVVPTPFYQPRYRK